MNPDHCNLHKLPINQICGLDNCSMIMCESCFAKHQAESKHSTPIIMDSSTISFFINFSYYILKRFQEFTTIVKKSGINLVFQIVGGIPNFLDTKTILVQIEKITIEIIQKNRNLIQNNRNYVLENRNNYRNLLHPEFLRDLYKLAKEQWNKNAQRLCQQLRNALITHFPTRYIFKRISIQINPALLNEIQFQRKQLLSQNPQKAVQQNREPSKLSDLEISKVESIIQQKLGNIQEDKKQPTLSKNIKSFYQALQKSQVNLQQNPFQIGDILRQHPAQEISPNFLSYEDLEKQIEQILIQNELLRQANLQLAHQNASLKRQNVELKAKRDL